MKKDGDRREKNLKRVVLVLVVLVALPWIHFARQAFLCDGFKVKGHSMDPTMRQGGKVWVNKLIMGARIYKCFDFDKDTLSCFRLPGLRNIKVGDIAVFNYPRGWDDSHISFKINYVYCKRCVGVPGDTVTIIKSQYHNSCVADIGIPAENEIRLGATNDSLLIRAGVLNAGHFAGLQDVWTIKDFGPLLVPGKGITVLMNMNNLALYKDVIVYETHGSEEYWLDKYYTFRNNYYFFAGDNVLDSKDSRYFGFVPEDFIIGIMGFFTNFER